MALQGGVQAAKVWKGTEGPPRPPPAPPCPCSREWGAGSDLVRGPLPRPLPRRDHPPSPRPTPGDAPQAPCNPPHCPPALRARTTLPEVLRGPGGRGSTRVVGGGAARAAALGQCGAPRGGHVPLFGAFVRARVCWCSECGQAARTEQVGAGLGGGGGWLRPARGTRSAGGAGPWQRPPAAGRRAGLRASEGLVGGGRSALCVARAEPRLCPRSLGARLFVGRGLGDHRASAPGCRRGDNRGRGPSFTSLPPFPAGPAGVPIV